MKRLIVCADGTWNTPEQQDQGRPAPTNVYKLHNSIAARSDDSVEQSTYYHPGVGTEGGWLSRLAGGMWGHGLGDNIQSAYRWLGENYEPGDEVYLFGFSRGSFTVRSLAGMIGRCGLLQLRELEAHEAWQRIKAAYSAYRLDGEEYDDTWCRPEWPRHLPASAPIHFLGVWDTVGALGIPNDLSILDLLDNPRAWSFHDTRLGEHVQRARHAVALDEYRASFSPALWEGDHSDRDVEQVWFAGAHSDVGGGYADFGLADIALKWMVDEASKAGLKFRDALIEQVAPNPQGVLHDSYQGVWQKLRSRPRAVPPVEDASVHTSVQERRETPPISQAPYRESITVQPDKPRRVTIYARERWNDTSLFLEPGKYRFSAAGEWLDKSIACGPGGADDGNFQLGEIVHIGMTAWGWAERGWRQVTGNRGADFPGTRRIETEPWFALIGVIANEAHEPQDCPHAGDANDGSPRPHVHFGIGDGREFDVQKGGYLFAYANDAWAMYANNRGSVQLVVERIG
ncbi:MAG: DUF2235 domain-containing protein [Planctomycetota bacterium]